MMKVFHVATLLVAGLACAPSAIAAEKARADAERLAYEASEEARRKAFRADMAEAKSEAAKGTLAVLAGLGAALLAAAAIA